MHQMENFNFFNHLQNEHINFNQYNKNNYDFNVNNSILAKFHNIRNYNEHFNSNEHECHHRFQPQHLHHQHQPQHHNNHNLINSNILNISNLNEYNFHHLNNISNHVSNNQLKLVSYLIEFYLILMSI